MFYQFGKLSIDGTQVVQLVNRGGKYQGKKLDINAPDSYYTDLGLIPIVGDTPSYDRENQKISMSYEITPNLITRVFTIEDLPIEIKRKNIENKIADHIHSKVEEYNSANALAFKDVYSCGLYKDMTGYTHQAFCIAVWDWQTSVWEYARAELIKVMNGTRSEPTAADFITEIETNVPLVLP